MSDPRGKTFQDLLRFCLENTAHEDASGSSDVVQLDDERQRWLQEALGGMAVNVVQEMRGRIAAIKKYLENRETDQGSDYKNVIEAALEDLIDYAGQFDNAADFHKIGGYEIFEPLFDSGVTEFKIKGCELLAELVQNHDYCQEMTLEFKLVQLLMKTIDDSKEDHLVRIKALYALSCSIRDNKKLQKEFEINDGFSTLLRAMQQETQDNKLRIKATFLMSILCQENPEYQDILYKMGFVEQIVALLQGEHDLSHEHLLATLLSIISKHEASRIECQRPEFKLENLLNKRLKSIQGKDEFREEEEYCNKIKELCFSTRETDHDFR